MEFRHTFRALATAAASATTRVPIAPCRFFSTTRLVAAAPRPPRPPAPAPWSTPKPTATATTSNANESPSLRTWDTILPPKVPKRPTRSPLLAGRRDDLLNSAKPESVYGLMGLDMGLADRGIFNEEDFLSRHSKRAQAPEMLLRPSTGRIIRIGGKTDVANGFKKMARLVATNNIKRDKYTQAFHERPGLRRKRLKSERWRARFKDGFRDVIVRTQEIRAQGW